MSWRIAAVLVVVSVSSGCQPDEATESASSGQASPGEPCNWLTATEPGEKDEPLCDIEFREVARLQDLDSITPHPPVMVLQDGRYVTATYSLGKIALWSPDGVLLDVVGQGPGEGPGEFDYAEGFAQVVDDALLVFTGLPVVHRYTTSGRYVRSIRLPTAGGATAAVTYRGFAITTANASVGRQGFLLRGDSAHAFGLRGRLESALVVAAAEDIGVSEPANDFETLSDSV